VPTKFKFIHFELSSQIVPIFHALVNLASRYLVQATKQRVIKNRSSPYVCFSFHSSNWLF